MFLRGVGFPTTKIIQLIRRNEDKVTALQPGTSDFATRILRGMPSRFASRLSVFHLPYYEGSDVDNLSAP